MSEGAVEVGCDTRLGRVEESEDVLIGVDEVSVDRAVVGHDKRDVETEGLPEEGIDLGEGASCVVGREEFHPVVDVAFMLGKCVVQIDFFEDSSAEGIVPALHAFRSVYRSDKSVFGIIGVTPGIE